MVFKSLFSRNKKESLDKGLEKSKQSFFTKLSKAVVGKSTVDEEVLDNLEEVLVTSDVGVDTTVRIIQRVEERVARDKYLSVEELDNILKEEIAGLLTENASDTENNFEIPADKKPYVILVVGVNGVGKTTTIGKLAAQYKNNGKSVMLGAADTFRAAAVEQLILWGERAGVPVVSHGMNADPASVAFETVKKGVEDSIDVVIIDTAGRLHTKVNLMNELSKIRRVVQKFMEEAPHEVLLVLDGSTGQNAVIQAREFTKATDVTSLAITKLDGTAKGGVVIGISDEFRIPVKYIGVGEKIEDLQVFDKIEFVDSFFKNVHA
jgi:fused signal recognition particle receptor